MMLGDYVTGELEFVTRIETMKIKEPNLSYLELISIVAEEFDVEIEDFVPLITGPLKERIYMECLSKRMLVKTETNKHEGSATIF